jgi:hypothetical protein
MKHKLWIAVITCLAYCIDKELWKAIEYLKEQVRVLKEQQEKARPVRSLYQTPGWATEVLSQGRRLSTCQKHPPCPPAADEVRPHRQDPKATRPLSHGSQLKSNRQPMCPMRIRQPCAWKGLVYARMSF